MPAPASLRFRIVPSAVSRGPLLGALLGALLSGSALTASAPAFAQDAPAAAPKADTVHVEIALVRASRGPASVDAALQPVARDLSALPYSRFERIGGSAWTSKVGAAGNGTVGDYKVVTTVTSAEADAVGVTVEVFRGAQRITHTTFQRPWGRAHVLSVGKEGEAAIVLPVRVTR